MEQIALFLRSNRFANRMFKDVAALKEACRTARRHHENHLAQTGPSPRGTDPDSSQNRFM